MSFLRWGDLQLYGGSTHFMRVTLASPRSFEVEVAWVERSIRLVWQIQGTHLGRLPLEDCACVPQGTVESKHRVLLGKRNTWKSRERP